MPAYNYAAVEVFDVTKLPKINPLLPVAIDATTLAYHLGINTRTLMYLIVKKSEHYKVHTIPKKSGGMRVIHAPSDRMKFVQCKMLETFFNPLTYPSQVGAYVPNKTTRETAAVHAGNPLLIVMDIKDFFPSTRRAWVRECLHLDFGYPHNVAGLMADLCTVAVKTVVGERHGVPQGAPTSGAVCNWVAVKRLDEPILKICAKWQMSYTRYADDLAFSHKDRLDHPTTDTFIAEILQVIQASGYRINRKKLRVTRSGRQQRLLGMTINEKPNIMRQQARKLRSRIHHCKMRGFDPVAQDMGVETGKLLLSQMEGMISYYYMINPLKAAQFKAQLDAAKAAHPL